jgi:hypothetical protein
MAPCSALPPDYGGVLQSMSQEGMVLAARLHSESVLRDLLLGCEMQGRKALNISTNQSIFAVCDASQPSTAISNSPCLCAFQACRCLGSLSLNFRRSRASVAMPAFTSLCGTINFTCINTTSDYCSVQQWCLVHGLSFEPSECKRKPPQHQATHIRKRPWAIQCVIDKPENTHNYQSI